MSPALLARASAAARRNLERARADVIGAAHGPHEVRHGGWFSPAALDFADQQLDRAVVAHRRAMRQFLAIDAGQREALRREREQQAEQIEAERAAELLGWRL